MAPGLPHGVSLWLQANCAEVHESPICHPFLTKKALGSKIFNIYIYIYIPQS